MKKISFIGAYDKTDLIVYVAKILATARKKVLIIDTTITQKAKYVVPAINPTIQYITEFEEIDIAVGFKNYEEIKKYLSLAEGQDLGYDYVFVDTDNVEGFEKFELENSFRNYFVTSFDAYSLKKGLEILSGLKNTLGMKKILFAKEVLKEDKDYLNYLSLGYKVIWEESELHFPIENGDLSAIYENHRVGKIKLKKMSAQFKDGIAKIAEEIMGDTSDSEIRRLIKIIERGV